MRRVSAQKDVEKPSAARAAHVPSAAANSIDRAFSLARGAASPSSGMYMCTCRVYMLVGVRVHIHIAPFAPFQP